MGFGSSGFQKTILNLVYLDLGAQLRAQWAYGKVGCGGSVFQKDIVNFVHNCEAGLWQGGLWWFRLPAGHLDPGAWSAFRRIS